MPGSELPLAQGSLWDLSCWFCIDSVFSVLVLRGVSSSGYCLAPPAPSQLNATLREPPHPPPPPAKKPRPPCWAFSCGPGIVSVPVTRKSKFGQIKTQDQRNQHIKQPWGHLLTLALQRGRTNSRVLFPHPPPHTLGAVSSLSAVSIYESQFIDIYLCLSLEECFCGGIGRGRIIQGNFMWLLTKVFFSSS